MSNLLRTFLKDESGGTGIEYGLIAGLVTVAAIAALSEMANALHDIFDIVNTGLQLPAP